MVFSFCSVCEILLSRQTSALSVFRSIRLLRIFKLVRPVRYQLLVVIKTMTSVMTFFGLLFLFIFAFAILGMNLFGGKFKFPNKEGKSVTSRSNFDSFLWAMVSVFQVSHSFFNSEFKKLPRLLQQKRHFNLTYLK